MMTGLTTPSGTVSGFSGDAGAWQVFDKDPSTSSFSAGVSDITYQLGGGAQMVADAYYITAVTSNDNVVRTPAIWRFEGSNDGVNWTTLDTRQAQTGWTAGET